MLLVLMRRANDAAVLPIIIISGFVLGALSQLASIVSNLPFGVCLAMIAIIVAIEEVLVKKSQDGR
jgi:hypothetical protein